MTSTNNHVAVFVDVENIVFSLRNRFGVDANFQDIMTRCREYGRVKIARAYGQWDEKFLVREIQWLNNCGFDLMHVPTSTHKANGFTNKSKPNIVDIYMTVDAMRVLAEDESISTFVLLTGDGDFIPLVNAIKRAGKSVIAVGVDRCWSDNLESAVDEFLPYSEISPTSIGLINVDEIDLDNRVIEIVKTMRAQGHETPSLQQLSEWLKTGIEGYDDRRLITSESWYYRDLRAYLQNRLGPKGYQIRKKGGKEILLAPDSATPKETASNDAVTNATEPAEKETAPKKKSRNKGKGKAEDKKRGKRQDKSEKKLAQKAAPSAEPIAESVPADVVIEDTPVETVEVEAAAEAVEAPAPEVSDEELTYAASQALLVRAVTKLSEEGRNPRASIVKLTMRRLNDQFNEKNFLNASGQRFTKFDEFLIDAEADGLVRLEGAGVYREVYLPSETDAVEAKTEAVEIPEAEVAAEPVIDAVETETEVTETPDQAVEAATETEIADDVIEDIEEAVAEIVEDPVVEEVVVEAEPPVAAVEVDVEVVSDAVDVEVVVDAEAEIEANPDIDPEAENTEDEASIVEDTSEVVAEIEAEAVAAPVHVTDELSIEYVSTAPEVEESVLEDANALDIPPVNEVVVLEDQESPVEEDLDLPPFLKTKTEPLEALDVEVDTPSEDVDAEAADERVVEVAPEADLVEAVEVEAEPEEVNEDVVAEESEAPVVDDVEPVAEAPTEDPVIEAPETAPEINPLPDTGEIDLPGEVTQQFQLREKIKAIESELGGSIATGQFAAETDEGSANPEALGLLKPLGEIATGPLPDGLSSITEKLETAAEAVEEDALDIFADVEESQELTVEELESIMQHNDDLVEDASLVETTLDFEDLNTFAQEEFIDDAASEDVTDSTDEADTEVTRGILADEEVKRQVVMWMNGYNAFPATIDALKEHCHAMRDTSEYGLSNGQVDQLVLDAVMAGILQMEPTLTTPALYNLNITKDTVAEYLNRSN